MSWTCEGCGRSFPYRKPEHGCEAVSLFDQPPDPDDAERRKIEAQLPPAVRRTDPDTSRLAARWNNRRPTQRAVLLAAIRQAGPEGRTNDELESETGIRLNSLTRRVTDLKELGMVRDSGQRREASSGSQQIVWVSE